MSYRQLRAFHNVAIHGGFSRAAAAIYSSQPALSEQVRRLEQDYDILLFRRSNRRVELTPAGEQLLKYTQRFFDAERQAEEYLTQRGRQLEGRLRLIVDSACHITAALRRFREDYPGVKLSLKTGNSDEMLAALRDYDAEIAIAGSIEAAPDLKTIPLGESPIVACIATDYLPARRKRMSLREIAKSPLVFREPGSRTRQKLEQEAARQKLVLSPAIEVEGREAMREVVASGAGIGFVSRAEFGMDTRLRPLEISDADLQMSETLVYLSQRENLRLIRAFVDSLLKTG